MRDEIVASQERLNIGGHSQEIKKNQIRPIGLENYKVIIIIRGN